LIRLITYVIIIFMSEAKFPKTQPPSGHEAYTFPEMLLLNSGRLEAVVNLDGAIIEELTLNTDGGTINLFFPRQEIPGDLRPRGGSHICFPVFGPSEHLDQHGFGRDVAWVVDRHRPESISLSLKVDDSLSAKGAEQYRGLSAELDYSIVDSEDLGDPYLNMTLAVFNEGTRPMFLIPAFHPYFALPEGLHADQVELWPAGAERGLTFSEDDLDKTVMVDNPSYTNISLRGRRIKIAHRGLPINAVWSNRPESYICVEPTAAGPQSNNQDMGKNWLQPGEHRIYSAEFSWAINE